MTNEDKSLLVAAYNEGISGRFNPSDPTKPIARLQASLSVPLSEWKSQRRERPLRLELWP